MSRYLALLTALLMGGLALVLAGCGGGSTATVAANTVTLATSGGADAVTLLGDPAALPAGVQATDLTVTVVAAGLPAAPAGAGLLAAVQCGPAGTVFAQPVTLVFPLNPAGTPGEMLPAYLLNAAGDAWILADAQATVAANGLTASLPVTHFSTYAIFSGSNATLPGDKFFTFETGVIDGGVPSEIMYNDTDQTLSLPHASALAVDTPYASITQAPFGEYRDSNGVNPPTFPATVGQVYIFRSGFIPGSDSAYFKLQILSATPRPAEGFGAVTFKFARILPIPRVAADGEWEFTGGYHLSVLGDRTMDLHIPDYESMYCIDGNFTSANTFTGTFTTWPGGNTVTGQITVTLTLSGGTLAAQIASPDDNKLNLNLTGGVKQ
jgi:hypothetical protein